MGEARRRHLAREAFLALPLHLQQPPLPVVLCPCLRPGRDFASVPQALEHVSCQVPFWMGKWARL